MKKHIIFLLVCSIFLSIVPIASFSEENIQVTATFYPVYVLAENVLSGVPGVALSSMTPPSTGCLHDYQLLTSDMRMIGSSRALLINGAGMESFLPDVQSQFPDLTIIDCSQGVELLRDGDSGEEEHEHGEFNPHIWLSPKNAAQMVENLAAGLSALLPGSEELIRQNAKAYQERLLALDEKLSSAIAQLPKRDIVTFHEAFPYFAKAYDLNVVAVVALEPDEPVSPRMLRRVIQEIRDAGCPPLFSEPQYESSALRSIAAETGAPVFELDPLVTGDGALSAYEDTMLKNLSVLREALQ